MDNRGRSQDRHQETICLFVNTDMHACTIMIRNRNITGYTIRKKSRKKKKNIYKKEIDCAKPSLKIILKKILNLKTRLLNYSKLVRGLITHLTYNPSILNSNFVTNYFMLPSFELIFLVINVTYISA